MNKKRMDWIKKAEDITEYYSANKEEVINELMNLIYEMSSEVEEC